MSDESIKQEKKYSKKNTAISMVRDYTNDPYFVKKADASQKFLEEHGFPKYLDARK